jgi:hypothetical protein
MKPVSTARGAVLTAFVLMLSAGAWSSSSLPGYDAAQLYNLGNAYARAGQPGLAVLSYERARLLTPTDEDIEINLRRVREAAHVLPEPRGALEFLRLPGPLDVAALALVGLLAAGLSAIAWRRRSKWPRLLAAGAVLGAGLIGWAAFNAGLVWPKLHSAVVIAANAPVRAAPAPLGDALFALPAAETVDITAEHEDFVLIKTLQGRAGWMPRAAVALIVPRK